jgi:catechol 2,3-dioxygenase-like lactoylglutathione lyase family enzyme
MSPDYDRPSAPGAEGVAGFDHVALPMEHTEAMSTFYKNLGMEVTESDHLVQVYLGHQMINFHRPEVWQRGFSLRAPAARPPCGDLCFVWNGSQEALRQVLDAAGAVVEEGPVERRGGRKATASSIYTRDPDGNLLEFMSYPGEDADAG